MPNTTLCFERYALDLAREQLHSSDGPVELPPLSFRLIRYLVLNRQRTVSLAELRDEIWQGLHVSESAVHQALRQARRALDDDGRRQRVIRTVRGGGYRFAADVAVARGAADTSERPADGYVGRAGLVAALERRIEGLRGGRGGVVLLRGEAGIGKTRTLEELERIAWRHGVDTVRGAGNPHLGAPPFWPWLQVFRDLSAYRPVGRLRREIQTLAPALLDIDPLGEPAAALPGTDGARFRLFDAATRCLREASALGPLLVTLDDLHEAGAMALELVDFIARGDVRAPLLVVGAYRPAGPHLGERGVALLARLEGRTEVEIRSLDALSETEAWQLVEQQEERSASRQVVDGIVRSARGNPFYLVELVRRLGRTTAPHEPEDWERLVARGARELIAERLAALGPATLELLRWAAVLGTTAEWPLLCAVARAPTQPSVLAEARELGLLSEAGPHRVSFPHALVRDAIYTDIPLDARRALHLRTAEVLREIGRPPTSVAHHLAAAAPLGDMARTIECLRDAGDHARSVFDVDGAHQLYRRGLDLLDRWPNGDPAARCELLVRAGEVALRGDSLDEGRAQLAEAMGLARSHGWAQRFSRAALAYADASEYLAAANEQVARLLEEALALIGTESRSLRARLLGRLAVEVRYRDGAQAAGLLEQAIAEARASDEASTLARVLEDASWTRWSAADPSAWLALNQEIVLVAEHARDYDLLFQGVKGLATAHMELGDRAAMEREIDRCTALANEFPAPYQKAAVQSMYAARDFLNGDLDRAEQRVLRALASGIPSVTPPALVQLYYHRLETGRIAEMESEVRRAVATSPAIVGWRFALARLLVELDRLDEARAELAAAGGLDRAPRDRLWLLSGAILAESVDAVGDVERARASYELLRPHAAVNIVSGSGSLFYGNVGHFVGLLCTTLGRLDEADSRLAAAQYVHEKMGAVAWGLRTRLEQARVLALRGEPERADTAATAVETEASRLGLHALARRAARPR